MSKRLWSYRSGDIKENLGLVLLQAVGFLSPTPRTEDVGVDVAVFLQRPDGPYLHPESGFYVQIKSSETDRIEFDETATKQLLGYDLPFYIALVDGPRGEVTLHSLSHLFQCFWWDIPKTITLDKSLDVIRAAHDLSGWLSEPLMRWGLKDAFDKNFRAKAHDVLSAYLEVDMSNIILRNLGIRKYYNVVTNDKPLGVIEHRMEVSPNYDPADDLTILQTALPRLLMDLIRTRPEMEARVMKFLASYEDLMASAGFKSYWGPPLKWVLAQVRDILRGMVDSQRAHPSDKDHPNSIEDLDKPCG